MILHYLSAMWTALAPGLGNHLWQSTLFAAAAGLLTLALRKNSARVRYGIWLAASAKFLIPFSWLIAAGSRMAWKPAPATPAAGLFLAMEQVGQPFAPATAAPASRAAFSLASMNFTHLLPVVFAVWLCGFLAVVVIWCARWVRISSTLRNAIPLDKGRELEALQRLERAGLIRTRIELLKSETSLEPGVFGIKRPVLVWPTGISERLADEHLEAILAHEVCHVRRRDNLAALMHMLVEAIFWFHPLVWWLGARLLEEREQACDEEVLETGREKQVYAESILKICEFCVGSPLTCVAGVTGADLKRRIARIMSEQVARRLDFGRKLLLSAGLAAALAVPVVFGLMQAPQSRAAAARGQEAATTSAAGTPWQLTSFGPSTVPAEKMGGPKKVYVKFGPDGLSGVNVTAKLLIQDAFGVLANQIDGAPSWANTDGWDFEAKGEITLPKGEKPIVHDDSGRAAMFQTLLIDKFKLAFHRETRQLPVYELVLDPGGSKLAEAKPGDPFGIGIRDPQGNKMPSAFKVSPGEMIGQSVQTSDLAGALSQRLATNVLDNTGLKGRYDFKMTWTPNRSGLPSDAPAWTEAAGPSLLEALQGQLGLQLKTDMTPMEVIVIDHIEKPTAN